MRNSPKTYNAQRPKNYKCEAEQMKYLGLETNRPQPV